MNECARCKNYAWGPLGSYCEKEREIEEAQGFADLGFPTVGDRCPHWNPKEEGDEGENVETR